VLALAKPFEMLLPDDNDEDARLLFREASERNLVYLKNVGKQKRMEQRFLDAGFVRLSVADLDGCDVEESAAFIFVPESVDVDFKEIIAKRLVA